MSYRQLRRKKNDPPPPAWLVILFSTIAFGLLFASWAAQAQRMTP